MKLKTMPLKTLTLLAVLAWGSMPAAQAHHSVSLIEMTKVVEIKGVLLSVEFVNPHAEFRLESKDASGKAVTWLFESQPPQWFRGAGIKKTDFSKAVGQPVTIAASVAKDGSSVGLLRKMTFADGTFISLKFGGFACPTE